MQKYTILAITSVLTHKFQLSAYALLIEEHYSTKVKRGFVYYIPEDKPVEIEITETVKNYLKRTIKFYSDYN
jgi:CRISPR-associated exonuclease Cas4